MKKYLSLLLVFTMLLGVLAGCGSANNEASNAVSSGSEVAASTPETPNETQDSAAEAPEASASAESEAVVSRNITLPIVDEPITYTYWLCYAPFAGNLVNTDTMEGILVLDAIQEQSNIHFDITAANGAAERDNFNLMVAAGDYCDILSLMGYYSTGLEGAVEEGIIQDLADVLPEQCPTYWSYLTQDTTTLMSAYTDSGYMPTICTLVPEVGQEVVGAVVREDWLSEFGMEMPETMDELYGYLEKSYLDKDAQFLVTNTEGVLPNLGFGLNLNLDAFVTGTYGYTVEDGTVQSSFVSENLKDYLKFMNKLYANDIISKDFYSTTNEDLSSRARLDFGLGLNSMVDTAANNTSDIMMNVSEDDFSMAVLPHCTKNKGDESHVGPSTLQGLMKNDETWSFSTDCEDIQPLLDLVEWLYSEDGYTLTNYGVEGETYTLDENGEPQYTDLIVNNPDGLSYFFASYVYASNAAWGFVPFINDMRKTWYDFNDNQWQVYEDLKTLSDCAYNYPTYAVMTVEESTEYASIESDLAIYRNSRILEFITGAADIDAEFDTYVETLYDMGLQDLIDIKQAAYDRASKRAQELGA